MPKGSAVTAWISGTCVSWWDLLTECNSRGWWSVLQHRAGNPCPMKGACRGSGIQPCKDENKPCLGVIGQRQLGVLLLWGSAGSAHVGLA